MAQEAEDPYRGRLAQYVEGRDPLEMQRAAPARLASLVAGAGEGRLSRRTSPGKWSVTEILAHLAEDELATSWRYRQMLEHDGAALLGFDQDEWARLGDYRSWKPAEALEMFRLLREANLRLLARLSPEQWEKSGIHSERGRITVRELARHMAAHDVNHILQVEGLLSRRG